MVHTYKKLPSWHCASFLTLTEVKCFKYSASCWEMLFTESAVEEMFCSIKTFFLAFPLLLSSSRCLSHPFPPLTLRSQSFPHFWSIFYALLHFSQVPFTVHYLLPSFTNTLCTSLSFLQSLCFPPSLPHSPPVNYDTFLYFSLSPSLLSLCLFSGHVIPY